jgi:hypothetical protein
LALQAAMASELASRALPPTRDGFRICACQARSPTFAISAVANNADPIFSKSRIGGADSANDRSVGTRIGGTGRPEVAPLPGARSQVRGESLKASVAKRSPTQAATFDARNEIVRNPDGTFHRRRSQQLGKSPPACVMTQQRLQRMLEELH